MPDSPITRGELTSSAWSQDRISNAVRTGAIDRVLPATYLPGDRAHDARSLLASAIAHYRGELVAVLATAALLHGLPTPWPADERVHVRLPPGREQIQRAGFRIHTWQLASDEVTLVDGLLVTTVARTIADLMCAGDRLSAVAALDAALAMHLIDEETIRATRLRTRQRRGSARSREWWDDADARAESPLETRVRLRASDGGYPPDELQKEFVVNGETFRTDFAWRKRDGRWLVGEADGKVVHDVPEALHRDRSRANGLVSLGDVDIARFTWVDSVPPLGYPRSSDASSDHPDARDLGEHTEERRTHP